MRSVDEWSLEFDLLWNNIVSDKAPGLNEYEKSVFLTRAEESVVVMLYNGGLGDAFESTEELTHYLGTLVRQSVCPTATDVRVMAQTLTDKSKLYKNPSDMLFRTWESCRITTGDCGDVDVAVTPVTQDEFWKTVRNPFKKQNSRKVLRLSFTRNTSASGTDYDNEVYSELVSDFPIKRYTVRYLAKPEPIILENLSGGLSINGKSEAMTCKLPEIIHQTILVEAVKMAKAVWNT